MTAALSLPQAALSVLAGGLTTLSPCVFPLLPLVLGGAVQAHRAAPLAMGLGMILSFAGMGLLVGAAGPALGLDADRVRTFGALLMLGFALLMLVPAWGERFTRAMVPLASAAQAASTRVNERSLRGALVLGGLLGLVWSPCSGPLLGSALSLVASEGGATRGALLLGLFGLGAATPLVVVAYASRSGLARARGWLQAHGDRVRQGFALLLGAMGLAVLLGWDKQLEIWFLDRLPDAWVQLTIRL